MQILFRYFSIRLGIEKVPMPFSKRLLKISKAPAIKTGTRLNFQRKKQSKFRSFSRYTFNCYAPTHLFYKLMDNRKTKTASFFRPSFVTLIEPFKKCVSNLPSQFPLHYPPAAAPCYFPSLTGQFLILSAWL